MSTHKIRPSDYPFAGTPTATPRTDAAAARQMRDKCAKLETELAAAKAECNRLYESSPTALDALTAELTRLRTELALLREWQREVIQNANAHHAERREAIARAERAEEQLALKNSQCEHAERAAAGALAERDKAEAALAFIASNGGTTHETECGPISCNGSWCAQQARAAIDAAMKP